MGCSAPIQSTRRGRGFPAAVRWHICLLAVVLAISGCSMGPSKSPTSTATPSPTPAPSPTPVPSQANDVLTYHNDNARTGLMSSETILTPANVNATSFGLLRTLSVDGKVDAQPLYVSNLGNHNLLLVATEHGTVYGFDADSGSIVWQVSMLQAGESPSDNHRGSQVTPDIGITATPLIRRSASPHGTAYAVAMSKHGATYIHSLHALD